MLRVERITSLDLPALAPYRTMRLQREHHEQGIFVAEGEKVTRRLLESPIEVVSLVMPEKWLADLGALAQARPENITAYVGEHDALETLTGFSMYQGVLGVGKIPQSTSLEAALKNSEPPRLFVAADGLTSAENMGVVVRNCAAFGVQALLVGETCSHPYIRRSVRNSMGTIFKLPVVEPRSLADALRELCRHGMRSIAAHPHTDQRKLSQADFIGDCCVVFGSEGHGISEAVRAACDDCVVIPMHLGVDSLNVGSATAAFLYEAQRQRGAA
ncbi:MAG: RNA methyltransferase [Verrucomicrobia bacterium]|nr:RNA methyltransferase [Verrucomicrobiota bacterium]